MHLNEWFILPVIGVTANRLCFSEGQGLCVDDAPLYIRSGSPTGKATLRKAG